VNEPRRTKPSNREQDYVVLACVSSFVSVLSLLHYYRWGQILLSGDAVAHINIARRVFDSRTPGPLQLGTVWLPLQHILTVPFISSDWAWSTGIGGSIPSMVAYVAATIGMYRLVRGGLQAIGATTGLARTAAWMAAAIVAGDPNLIYLQTTALNEPLSLALLIWATVYFTDFVGFVTRGAGPRANLALRRCGWLLAAGMLVRYDAWFAASFFVVAAALVVIFTRDVPSGSRTGKWKVRLPEFIGFVGICALAPALWFGYNTLIWGNPLEFATGPYSARAIEQRGRQSGDPHHPGWHSPYVAAEYFLRNATLTVGETRTQPRAPTSGWERIWLPLALIGSALAVVVARSLLPWLLLWIPLPFYTLALAWGSVPIFIPQWWPFSYYNTRYGLQLLPALAAFSALALYLGMVAVRGLKLRVALALITLTFVGASYASVWRNVPLCLREVRANGGPRYALDRRLAIELSKLPAAGTLLMYVGNQAGALQGARIPLRRTINEGNNKLWQAALSAPAAHADYVIAGANDPVAQAVAEHPGGLQMLEIIEGSGQPRVAIYRSVQ
jgi:hypothetical protein